MHLIRDVDHIEFILGQFRDSLGARELPYRNHVYRVYNLAVHLASRPLQRDEHDKLAMAAAFHDLGIWTAKSMDYLHESERLARDFLTGFHLDGWVDEVGTLIRHHHQLTTYRGAYEELTNLFRKADWIDVSGGLKAFGVRRMDIVQLYGEFPPSGFHTWLAGRLWRYALRHPLRPFPMVRR